MAWLDEKKGIEILEIGKRGENIFASLKLEKDLDFFNGHFPKIAILPAAAQLEIVVALVEKASATSFRLGKVERVKFGSKVRPGDKLSFRARFEQEKGRLDFTLAHGLAKACSGIIFLEQTK
ncbi:MAG: hypothetical protein GXP49_09330 [Deltaproteobacteria bacterium]|nr:hypothetical protein [Deltaproteobacteria bacterium]